MLLKKTHPILVSEPEVCVHSSVWKCMDINLYSACISVYLSVFVFAWGHLVVHGHPDVCGEYTVNCGSVRMAIYFCERVYFRECVYLSVFMFAWNGRSCLLADFFKFLILI